MSVDPDFNQTLDAYGYADNNPLSAIDLSGLDTCTSGSLDYQTCGSSGNSASTGSGSGVGAAAVGAAGVGVAIGSPADAKITTDNGGGDPGVNRAAGKAFEEQVAKAYDDAGEGVEVLGEQVTIRYTVWVNGVQTTKISFADLVVEIDGRIFIVDAKSGNATLTDNQQQVAQTVAEGDTSSITFSGANAQSMFQKLGMSGESNTLADVQATAAANFDMVDDPRGFLDGAPPPGGQSAYQVVAQPAAGPLDPAATARAVLDEANWYGDAAGYEEGDKIGVYLEGSLNAEGVPVGGSNEDPIEDPIGEPPVGE